MGSWSQEFDGGQEGMLRVSAARIALELGGDPSSFAVECLASRPEVADRIAVEHVVQVFCEYF